MADQNPQIPQGMAQFATEQRDTGRIYTPPEGAKRIVPPKEGMFYDLGDPSAQTDRLQAYERRYIIPVAMAVSSAFGVTPVHEDIYRHIGEHPKNSNLFCVMSRSGIKKVGDYLDWDPVVVVVKKFVIVRANCHLYPSKPDFLIRRLWLWNKNDQVYVPVEDDQTKRVDLSIIPYIMDRYVEMEGIA